MTNKYCGDDCEDCPMYQECFKDSFKHIPPKIYDPVTEQWVEDPYWKNRKGE